MPSNKIFCTTYKDNDIIEYTDKKSAELHTVLKFHRHFYRTGPESYMPEPSGGTVLDISILKGVPSIKSTSKESRTIQSSLTDIRTVPS